MCRIAAYQGPAIPIENIVIRPAHSLLEQSQSANEAKLAVNGDGFGIAWFNDDGDLGLYRDVLPAWADGNLLSICRMIKSKQFLAHVRASTSGETARVNCHPFTFQKWAFMHNGQIPNINDIRRDVEKELTDELFFARRGSTDSELFFLRLLSNGLAQNPIAAVEKTIGDFEKVSSTKHPNKYACVFSNGSKLFAFRHSSNKISPSLYTSTKLDNGGCAISSEPLDGKIENWTEIKENTFIEINGAKITTSKMFQSN